MNREKRLQVEKIPVCNQDFEEYYQSFERNYRMLFNLIKNNRKYQHTTSLGNTRISTDYAQTSSWTLVYIMVQEDQTNSELIISTGQKAKISTHRVYSRL